VENRATVAEDPAPAVPASEPPQAAPEQRSEAAPAAAAMSATLPAVYKVQAGQSLWSIAADELGSGSRYMEILDLNPQLRGDPGRLMPGQELTLPARAN